MILTFLVWKDFQGNLDSDLVCMVLTIELPKSMCMCAVSPLKFVMCNWSSC